MNRKQELLFEQKLASFQDAMESLLLRLRLDVDEELEPRLPDFAGKAYPLGRCREIRDGVFTRLSALLKQTGQDHNPALSALKKYLVAGGICQKIWGSLRDLYFQNALQIGCWYIDVANDTVDVTKPKIEILLVDEAGFYNIRDYFHFAAVARPYWNVSVYANTVFPLLAPLFPLVCVNAAGRAWLAPAYDEMIELTRRGHFLPSEQVLGHLPATPAPIREKFISSRQGHESTALLTNTGDPVKACQDARADGLMYSNEYRLALVNAYLALKQISG